MNDKIKQLTKRIDFEWKVQTVSKNKPQARCVAYINARDVMSLLDDAMGPENWQDDYKMVGDRWMAGIGIRVDEKDVPPSEQTWVWKWDTGESGNFEAEKSQVSDSFKRAGVKWGIGRFLYDLDMKYVETNQPGKGAYPVDSNGKRIWDLTKHINNK